MKLKTLRNIEGRIEVFGTNEIGVNSGLPLCNFNGDLQHRMVTKEWVRRVDLKQAGIVWAKATIEARDKYGDPMIDTTSWHNQRSMKTQLHFIKQFFNITEEDLR